MSDVMVTSECEQCGDQYERRSSWQKFCSGRCKKRASVARLAHEWEARRNDPAWQAAERERQRRWNVAHPGKAKAREASWRARHPEESRQKTKRWRDGHPDAVAARARRERLVNPDRVSARKAVHHAVKTGSLIRPGCCSACGQRCKPQAHHDDYTRKLDVRWLCARCHKLTHLGELAWTA